jgi:hypothetical protein
MHNKKIILAGGEAAFHQMMCILVALHIVQHRVKNESLIAAAFRDNVRPHTGQMHSSSDAAIRRDMLHLVEQIFAPRYKLPRLNERQVIQIHFCAFVFLPFEMGTKT